MKKKLLRMLNLRLLIIAFVGTVAKLGKVRISGEILLG